MRRGFGAAAIALAVLLFAQAVVALIAPGAAASTATLHVDGGNGSCSDAGPGSESVPLCDVPDAPPAGSVVVVRGKGSSYGYVNPRSANVTYWGVNAPEVSGLAGAVDPSLFAGRALPEVGDVDIEADGVVWRGFRHDGATTAPMASLDVRQAVGVRVEGNEIDYGGIRLRNADGTQIVGNYLHNGPTQVDGRAEIFCPCGVLVGNYNDGSGTDGSDDVVIRHNHWRDWRGDIVNVQNRASRTKILFNKGVHIEREPGSDEHTDTFQLVGSGDVEIVGNDFRDVQHGILITDHTPEDRNGDGWAIRVENNIIEARNGRSFLGPPGPGSRVVNNTFVRAETWDDDRDGDGEIDGNDWAGECDVEWTESRDPGAHSEGAVFANNFCKGSPSLVADQITTSANIFIPRFEEFAFLAGYELPAGSPAIDAADPAYAPGRDLHGRARAGAPDIGALERQRNGPGANPPAGGGKAARRAPARLRVLRARVRRGRLVMRLRLHRRATGKLRVVYVSGGRRTRFATRIPRRGGAWTVRRAVRGRSTGVLRVRYAGNGRVRPGRVRVRIRAGRIRPRAERTVSSSG